MSKGKDPAFLFYPGDYLKDTQCLSEKSQVAYDRIMCEHMRNICISQERLNFFTKRLNEDEKSELFHVLEKNSDGTYQISWVADGIEKRRNYSESRSKNRLGKAVKPKRKKTSSSYDAHMENGDINENKDLKGKKGVGKKPDEPPIEVMMPWQTDRFKVQWGLWKKHRSETDGHKYKPIGEQAALTELAKLAHGQEETGIAIIHQSMANSWKGFFELKQNGKQITGTGSGKFNRDDMEAGLAEVLRQQQRNSANSH